MSPNSRIIRKRVSHILRERFHKEIEYYGLRVPLRNLNSNEAEIVISTSVDLKGPCGGFVAPLYPISSGKLAHVIK